METVQRSVVARGLRGWREKGVNGTHGIFRALKRFCMTCQVNMWHYTFVKTHRTYNTESELESKLWTLVNNVSIWLINYNKCPTLQQDKHKENYWGERGYMRTPLNFYSVSVNQKTALKKSINLKNIYIYIQLSYILGP